MTKLSRRNFLKNQIATLAGLNILGLSSCLSKKPLDGFSLYLIHLEGAPLRSCFDLMLDPFNHNPQIYSPVPLKTYSHKYGQYKVPEVWFDQGKPSPLLENLMTVRGISTKSPHLSQCRSEWFESDSFKELFKTQETQRSNYSENSWIPQTPELGKIYENILPFERLTLGQNKTLNLEEVFENLKPKGTGPKIQMAILNQYKPGSYFESTGSLGQEILEEQLKFYKKLIKEIESLVASLKRMDLFNSSAILITSDRARVVTNPSRQWPLKTEPMWQGLNFSLFSGAIHGPQTLGHINKEHPKYAESFPGTWGVGLENWTPRHVHQLIADLCFPKGYHGQTRWMSDNPWLDRKPMGSLTVKQGPGLVL